MKFSKFFVCISLFTIFWTVPFSTGRIEASALNNTANKIELTLSRMSLPEKIGQLFIVAADGDLDDLIQNYHIGGFILFSRHTPTLLQTIQLTQHIHQQSKILPFVAIDQEGGRVSRIPFATRPPDARRLGSLTPQNIQKIGSIVGRELSALGFNLNLAPVMDVDTCEKNPVIGNRSFSRNPYTVADAGSAYISGLRSSGVAATAKHFPGHGETSVDSHFSLPVVNLAADRIRTVELIPFKAAIQAGADFIMIAHVSYPNLDHRPNRPASLSSPIVTELLRNELGYRGVILTDAMNMRSITKHRASAQAVKAAFLAGNDIILMPDNLPAAFHSLLSTIRRGEIPTDRLDESVRRILSLKIRLSSPPEPYEAKLLHALAAVGSANHKNRLQEILQEAGFANPNSATEP